EKPAGVGEWLARVEGADGILLLWELPSGVLAGAPTVRTVSLAGTGVEQYVDLEEASDHGVVVCNVPEYGANAVAEHAFALILAVARQIAIHDREVRQGWWQQEREGIELS